MLIKALVENISNFGNLKSEHGLGLYIETEKQKILFDTGASSLFAENANKMNADLADIDLAVISHGHYDHGGGLKTFLSLNKKAKIYIHQKAFGEYYSNRQNGIKTFIGLDHTLIPNEQFVFTGDNYKIDDNLKLFSNVSKNRLNTSGNKDLFKKNGEKFSR